MSIGTAAAIGIGAGVSAAAGIGSAVIGAGAAGSAASTQAAAADNAANLQYDLGEQSLGFQEGVYGQEEANAQPWLQTGGSAEMEMAQLLGLPPASNGATVNDPFGGTTPAVPGVTMPANPTGGGTPTQRPNGPIGTQSPIQARNGRQLDMSTLTDPNSPPMQYGGGPGMSTATMPGSTNLSGTPGMTTATMPASNGSAQSTAGQRPANGPGALPANSNPNASNLSPFAPWTTPFTAPTAAQAAATPGEQFMMQQGEQAIENQASASGTLGDTGTSRALMNYGEGLASTDYQQVYNNSLQQYQQQYNIYQNNQANQWNRLASLAGMGQTTAAQLNSAGQSAAGNVGNILGTTGSQVGQNLNNAGAATASGYIGAGNAYSAGVGNIGNLGSTLSLATLLNQNPGSNPGSNLNV